MFNALVNGRKTDCWNREPGSDRPLGTTVYICFNRCPAALESLDIGTVVGPELVVSKVYEIGPRWTAPETAVGHQGCDISNQVGVQFQN